MYNRVLKRPMFKRGGSSYQSQGTGITSPYDTPRKRYANGPSWEEIYSTMTEKTRDPRGDFSYASQGFSELGNPYKDDGSAKTIGEMLYAGAGAVRGSREKAEELERSGELAVVESQAGRKLQEEVMTEEKRQFDAKLKQERYLGELDAKGEKEFIVEQINSYWDPMIEAETDAIKKKDLADQKRSDTYNVIVLGEDISDKYKILSNTEALEIANDNARSELESTINPDTQINWTRTDKGYAEKLQLLINKYLRLATKFLDPDKKGAELDAAGGRVGRALGGGMTEDVNVMTKTPGGISDINVSETIEGDSGKTNEINISYEQLRDRLPPEISDEIVLLLSESYEAFADFAELQTQADVNEFNTKYNVQLFLPQQSGA